MLFTAGILAVLLGAVHSVLGEKLIFSDWRANPPTILRRHRNILWASWHIVSFLGLGIGGAFIWLSGKTDLIASLKPVLLSLALGFALSGLIVLYATRGRHPGWIVLLTIAVLTFLAP